ncbi:MAG TPA: DUF1670 domain-containing protein [Thermodesulfobacteriota bacterium]|nr:DUF1670 domain-containing protein [Thermodesulfobacteriota bacterium]
MTTGGPTEPKVGQLKIAGVLASEPAGKPLRECAWGECYVTYDAGPEDEEIRRRHGLVGLRRIKLLRIATEAHDQGIDLTQEALAKILGTSPKTVKRDIAYLRRHGIFLPTRGQQKDLGPVAPHQVEAVRLALEGCSEWEIAERILHPPSRVRRIVAEFAQAGQLLREGRSVEDVGRLLRLPRRLVEAYSRLVADATGDPARETRLNALLTGRGGDGRGPQATPVVAGSRWHDNGVGGAAARGRPRLPIFDEQADVLRREVFDYLLDLEIRKACRHGLPLALLAIEPGRRASLARGGRALAARALVEFLRAQLRATDLIGRATLVRYLVLLPLADASGLRRALDRLAVEAANSPLDGFVAGAACYPAHATAGRELVAATERALSAARQAGRPFVLAS